MVAGGPGDVMDRRHRAALAVDDAGRIILIASADNLDSASFARRIMALHPREAVLLDSGYSTALVWKGRVIVGGHDDPRIASRPVMHGLVITGRRD
jgi:hypothetical protein